MNKASHFLLLVQTAVITRYTTDRTDGTVALSRPVWAMEHLDDACKVAGNIPGDIDALDAAKIFVRYLFHEDQENEDAEDVLQILIGEGI